MISKFFEATNAEGGGGINWGKFLVIRFDGDDHRYRSEVADLPLLRSQGWGTNHLFVIDLATGEGAMFSPGGLASADLNIRRVRVCPMFEPFLRWLYKQDLSDLDALPALVKFTEEEAPSSFASYRRPGLTEVDEEEPPLVDGVEHPLMLADAATRTAGPGAARD